jgi:outer membrane murein-binding lipoprotein Lpp
MKISKRMLAVCLVLATVLSGMTLLHANAQTAPMTSQQTEHFSDALLRVNRGQIYESMSTKLMEKFNSRVASNGFSNIDLVSVTTNYGLMLDTFRSDYITYEAQLSSALNINCSNQPVIFYDTVSSARAKRNQVHADVVKLNQYIDQYQSAVNQFEKDYQVAADGAKQ